MYVLALDQGTTSSRAIVFDDQGEVRSLQQQPTTQAYPHPGWVNQDAAEIWRTTLETGRAALRSAGIGAEDVAAIGITNQRETTILWERATGTPVAPAIVWQSRQTSGLVDALVARGMGPTYTQITGLVPDAYFSATKIAWLLDQDPKLRRRAEAGEVLFGTVDSWLLWNLSGGTVHATDATNAARTMLYDIRAGVWSEPLLADLGIPRAMLPEVRSNAEVYCETAPEMFGAAIKVAGMAGDQHAALFGQACFRPGEAKNTYGTGSFLLMQTGPDARPSTNGLLTTVAWEIDGVRDFALEGAIFVTGAAVQWLRDGLGIIRSAAEVEALAASVPDSGGVVFVPALTGLGAPHWDQAARGTISGITRGTGAGHIARATLEAIAFQTRDVLDAMERDAGIDLTELRVDGGASSNNLLMQLQADVLGCPVVRPRNVESTALGAAYLAGLATGVWPDRETIRSRWREDRRFEPRWSQAERDERYSMWLRGVERAKGWAL